MRDLFLEEAGGDRALGSTELVHALQQLERFGLETIREPFHVEASREGIDRIRDPGLVRYDLLRPQGERGSLARG